MPKFVGRRGVNDGYLVDLPNESFADFDSWRDILNGKIDSQVFPDGYQFCTEDGRTEIEDLLEAEFVYSQPVQSFTVYFTGEGKENEEFTMDSSATVESFLNKVHQVFHVLPAKVTLGTVAVQNSTTFQELFNRFRSHFHCSQNKFSVELNGRLPIVVKDPQLENVAQRTVFVYRDQKVGDVLQAYCSPNEERRPFRRCEVSTSHRAATRPKLYRGPTDEERKQPPLNEDMPLSDLGFGISKDIFELYFAPSQFTIRVLERETPSSLQNLPDAKLKKFLQGRTLTVTDRDTFGSIRTNFNAMIDKANREIEYKQGEEEHEIWALHLPIGPADRILYRNEYVDEKATLFSKRVGANPSEDPIRFEILRENLTNIQCAYICANCGEELHLGKRDPVICRLCGHRIVFKKRLNRPTRYIAR